MAADSLYYRCDGLIMYIGFYGAMEVEETVDYRSVYDEYADLRISFTDTNGSQGVCRM